MELHVATPAWLGVDHVTVRVGLKPVDVCGVITGLEAGHEQSSRNGDRPALLIASRTGLPLFRRTAGSTEVHHRPLSSFDAPSASFGVHGHHQPSTTVVSGALARLELFSETDLPLSLDPPEKLPEYAGI